MPEIDLEFASDKQSGDVLGTVERLMRASVGEAGRGTILGWCARCPRNRTPSAGRLENMRCRQRRAMPPQLEC